MQKKKGGEIKALFPQNTYLPPSKYPVTEKLFPNIQIQERVCDKNISYLGGTGTKLS